MEENNKKLTKIKLKFVIVILMEIKHIFKPHINTSKSMRHIVWLKYL